MAFPGLIPSEPLLAQGVFISDATYTNDPDFGEFLAMAISPVPAEGLDDGATNATPEPMPIYAELASPFAVPCPSASASFSGRAMAGSSNPDPDCLECENNNCTEALREEIERVIKILRRQNLRDEAFLLEQMLELGNFEVDVTGDYTGHRKCASAFGSIVPGTRPTLYISPDVLCKDGAAQLVALMAGQCAVQWENPVLRRNDEMSGEAAELIFMVAFLKDLSEKNFAEFKKFMEALQKPIRAVEGPFPIMTCLLDALCKASMYKGARSDEAEAQARELKRVLQKIKDLNKEFEKLTREQQAAFVQNMIDKFKAIIVAIKTRNWTQLEILGIARSCIDPALMRLADEINLSSANLPGRSDTGRADENQTQDVIVPVEAENTVRIYPGEVGFQIGPPIPVAVPGGPHVAASLALTFEDRSPEEGNIGFIGVGTRSNGVVVIRRQDSSFSIVPMPGPAEVLALRSADVDDDGFADLVGLSGPPGTPSIVTYLRQPDVAFPFQTELTVPAPPGGIHLATGDWDRDGRVDLAIARPGSIDIFHQNVDPLPGTPRWTLTQTFPGVLEPTDLQTVDIDGDHHLDLVASDFRNSRVQVWLNDAPTGLRPGNSLVFPEPVAAVAVTDFDGNGVPDLLAALGETPRLALTMNPSWDSPPASVAPVAAAEILFIDVLSPASQLLLRDLDDDGDRDLVVVTSGGLQVFRRLFSTPTVECSLRITAIHAIANTLVIEREPIDPSVLGGPFKLLYRDGWQSEWRPVPAGDILSITANQWSLRRNSNSFRQFRIIADAP
jgi:hypothetical protein